MYIWITRHGQTNLNHARLMQGRTDEPLNETGLAQAEAARARIGDVHFDAVYASPLSRAIRTGAIIGGITPEDVIVDERIIETDFGPYEKKKYYLMGPAMTLYWALPEVFPAPKGVETIASMTERSASFIRDLEAKGYENVLVSCHGGILRALTGVLTDKKNGIVWRPKPKNCEIRVFESANDTHRLVRTILPRFENLT